MRNSKEKGITLVALVITIVVLILLAVISIQLVFNEDGIIARAQQAQQKEQEGRKKEEGQLDILTDLIEKNVKSTNGYSETEKVNVPKVNNGSDESTGLIPIKHNGTNWVVCEETDADWYDYSASGMKWANAMLSDGTYKKGTVKVGQVVQDTELGSMFVWIPRYAYSINKYKTAVAGTDGTTQNIMNVEFLKGNTNIGTSGKEYGTDYDVDKVATGSATPMIVHPAFNFGGADLQGIWVAKFEASMKEANNNTTDNNDVTDKAVRIVPNAESWRYIRIGKIFETCLNMKNKSDYQFSAAADSHLMKNSEWGAVAYLASSQYGKVPVENGSGSSYVEDEATKYHSYSAAGDYATNVNQSTTGDITGVYDLNGGAFEYVAAYWETGTGNLSWAGTSTYFPGNKFNSDYAAYWDKYEVSENEKTNGATIYGTKTTEGNKQSYQITKERVDLMKNIKGDGMYEAINEWSYYGRYSKKYPTEENPTHEPYELITWLTPTLDSNGNIINTGEDKTDIYGRGFYGNDYTLVGTFHLPFVRRGGFWGSGDASGLFTSGGNGGSALSDGRIPSGSCALAL